MENPLFIDLIQGAHLLFVVLGMGPAMYLDLRSLRRFSRPISQADIDEFRDIHRLVTIAFVGLWLSGAALIWVRTGFDIASFTPKLWCKIVVVTVLAANAMILNAMVFPALRMGVGKRLIHFPVRLLLPMTLCGGLSLAGWILALTLGSSHVLKTANWDTLLFVLLSGATLCVFGTLAVVFGARIMAGREMNHKLAGEFTKG